MCVFCHVCHEKYKLFYPAQNGELRTIYFCSSYVGLGQVIMQTSLIFHVTVRTMNTE